MPNEYDAASAKPRLRDGPADAAPGDDRDPGIHGGRQREPEPGEDDCSHEPPQNRLLILGEGLTDQQPDANPHHHCHHKLLFKERFGEQVNHTLAQAFEARRWFRCF